MSSRRSPLVKAEDIQNILKKWQAKRQSLKEEMEKPVLIFVGGAGTGKSSCIKVLLNITEKEKLAELNITNHGKCGTKSDVGIRYESHYLIAIDIQGKLQNQNIETYAEYVERILNKEKRIDIIIGVVEACGVRDGDIDTLIESLEIIYRKWEKPSVVIMNKYDQVKNSNVKEQYEHRKRYLEEQFEIFRKKLTWKFENDPSNPRGVFPVSADPAKELGSECPGLECIKQTNKDDDFPEATTKTLIKDAALHCYQCKQIYILKSELKDPDLERIKKYAQTQNLPIVEHEILPIGLGLRQELMQGIIFLTHEIVSFALMKSICKTLSDQIAATPIEIHKAVVKIYGITDAVEVDRLLCSNIAKKFDLEHTAIEHSEYEASRWKELGRLDRFERFLRNYFDRPDQGLSDYLVAWGIYYARKFHDIAITIQESFEADKSHEDIAKQCNEICMKYTDTRQLKYYQFILENDRDSAIKKYVLEYTKPET